MTSNITEVLKYLKLEKICYSHCMNMYVLVVVGSGQDSVQVIRKVIDKYEESLLQKIEVIKNSVKRILETQKADLIQLQNQ